jgi:uncharacterized membrane protein HdeD (DUF308 family)
MVFFLRIQHRFASRRGEWTAAGQSIVWGLVLLAQGDVFSTSTAFRIMAEYVTEDTLGWVMLAVGILRIIGLVINGSRKDVTPWIRVTSALLGCGAFTFISLAFAASGYFSVWLAAWPFAAFGELFNIHSALRDARVHNVRPD